MTQDDLTAQLRPIQPTIFVVFGATGDLMRRKLVPALAHMYEQKHWPEKLAIVGASRSIGNDATFQDEIQRILKDAQRRHLPKRAVKVFTTIQMDFHKKSEYQKLKSHIEDIENAWGICANKLFYFAVPPSAYVPMLQHLVSVGLNRPCNTLSGWTRILIEKPYGSSLTEAVRVERLLAKHFQPKQIYRIDHYLGKQTVQNILTFRFANNFLEPAWDRDHIEKIELRLHEQMRVSDRGAFYDSVGALLDVGHNHLLELLALITMDHPVTLTTENIWARRADILKSLEPIRDISRQTFRAQYEGYRKEKGVSPRSTTETFFRVTTHLQHPHWRGVPITIEGGKGIPDDDKRVIITFKHVDPCLCPPNKHVSTRIEFRIQPRPGIAVQFHSRKPGTETQLKERWMVFDFPEDDTTKYLAEYSQLLTAAIAGQQLHFVSGAEALASWRFIDPIFRAWKKRKTIPQYPLGSIPNGTITSHELRERAKTIGVLGLGKMGANISQRMHERGWNVLGYNRHPVELAGIPTFTSLSAFVKQLPKPRLLWLMVPNDAVEEVLFGKAGLVPLLEAGDVLIDGGNSNYKDSIRRQQRLAKKKIAFIDVGVSGGPSGALHGPALMVGGRPEDVRPIETLFYDIALQDGYHFFPGPGAGHFVKMIHNGIEYGMMQSLAEGFAILRKSKFKLDLVNVAESYNNGSVIESRLVDWLRRAYLTHGSDLKKITGTVAHTGEGAWTVDAAKKLGVPADIISGSLRFRKQSAKNPNYLGQILSALREQFGGHAAEKKRAPRKRKRRS